MNDVQFESSEKEFQFSKLVHHGKDKEADKLLTLESSLEVMGEARKAIPEPDPSWLEKDEKVMLDICRRKFKAYPHPQLALSESCSELAEATLDKRWGTGLDIHRTQEYLPDYWPGDNLMGKILKTV